MGIERKTRTLIVPSEGVVRASDIRRVGETEKWDIQAILDMQSTPQGPDPTEPGLHIPTMIRLEPEVPFSTPDLMATRGEEVPRRPYLKKGHFQEHGYTEGGEGCARLSAGMSKMVPHTRSARRGCTTSSGRQIKARSGWRKQRQRETNTWKQK